MNKHKIPGVSPSWFLPLLPMIVAYVYIWYTSDSRTNTEALEAAMARYEMLAIIIPAVLAILGLIIGHMVTGRKRYLNIIERLGKFEGVDLESRIGDTTKKGSLVGQHMEILSVASDTKQSVTNIATTIQAEKELREQRDEFLKTRDINVPLAYDALNGVDGKLEHSLKAQAELRAKVERLSVENEALQQENQILRHRRTGPQYRTPPHNSGFESNNEPQGFDLEP